MRKCFYSYVNAKEKISKQSSTVIMLTKKGGNIRMTKARRAKLQQEEEERRLREEEEARLQAARQEQERLERERKAQELEKLELKDSERRKEELEALRLLLEENHTAVTNWNADAAEKAKWERCTRCDGIPNPAEQREINAFISLWRDDPELSITPVLEQCKVALQLTDELKVLLRDVTDPKMSQKYQEAFEELQELIHSKLNLTTEEILKEASANVDTQTGNMQSVVKDDNVTLCLWANLRKNPRFSGFDFDEVGMGFEIPRQLAVSDVAVRILHTHYDHLTSLSKMAHPRVHTASQRSLTEEEQSIQESVIEKSTTSLQSRTITDLPAEGHPGQTGALPEQMHHKQREKNQKRPHTDLPAVGQLSHVQTQMEELSVKGDLNTPLALSMADHAGEVVDLMEYAPLGGVFFYEVFRLPPQAHMVKGWKIQQILDTGLQVFPYPKEQTNSLNSVSVSSDNEALIGSSIGVSMTLPDSVVFLEAPQVARWDAAEKQWKTDGITNIVYKEEEMRLTFNMASFQPFGLLHHTYANFPFRGWELRPLGQDSAVFTIKGALIDLSITIQGNKCMLQSEQEKGLSHFKGKWMSSSTLQLAMQKTGINVFVNKFTEEYVSTYGKDPLTEHSAYEQMALFASACAFSWSKWNAQCGPQHLVMQVCEHLGPACAPKNLWSLYLLGAQRSQKLKITESSDTFSPDHCPSTEFHSTFIHTLQDNMSTEGRIRTTESNFLFVDTVQSLLCSVRPLVYS